VLEPIDDNLCRLIVGWPSVEQLAVLVSMVGTGVLATYNGIVTSAGWGWRLRVACRHRHIAIRPARAAAPLYDADSP
jgi:hypothetical protein